MRLLKVQFLASWLFISTVQPAFAADRLVLISPHADEIQIEFEAGFKRAYRADTGRKVDVEWLDIGGGTSSILRYIKSEFGRSPEGMGIDLFFGGGQLFKVRLRQLLVGTSQVTGQLIQTALSNLRQLECMGSPLTLKVPSSLVHQGDRFARRGRLPRILYRAMDL